MGLLLSVQGLEGTAKTGLIRLTLRLLWIKSIADDVMNLPEQIVIQNISAREPNLRSETSIFFVNTSCHRKRNTVLKFNFDAFQPLKLNLESFFLQT